jgi:DNA-binding transcriptional MerR regulator
MTVYCRIMSGTQERKYGIRELVQASGVSRRTVRYYVQRGLLPPPEGAGRGHFYRTEHLERLLLIKELQGRGLGLAQIRVRLDAGDRTEPERPLPLPEIELATRIRIADGVELILSHGTEPPRPAQVRALAEAAARILGNGE